MFSKITFWKYIFFIYLVDHEFAGVSCFCELVGYLFISFSRVAIYSLKEKGGLGLGLKTCRWRRSFMDCWAGLESRNLWLISWRTVAETTPSTSAYWVKTSFSVSCAFIFSRLFPWFWTGNTSPTRFPVDLLVVRVAVHFRVEQRQLSVRTPEPFAL